MAWTWLRTAMRKTRRVRNGRTVVATIILVAWQSLYYEHMTEYWQLWRGNTDIPAWISKYEVSPERCVLVVDYSFVLGRPNVDFVHAPTGRDYIDQYLARMGRAACPHWSSDPSE